MIPTIPDAGEGCGRGEVWRFGGGCEERGAGGSGNMDLVLRSVAGGLSKNKMEKKKEKEKIGEREGA